MIETKLDEIIIGLVKDLMIFGDFDLIFNVRGTFEMSKLKKNMALYSVDDWIPSKLITRIHHYAGRKKWLGFDDLDLVKSPEPNAHR